MSTPTLPTPQTSPSDERSPMDFAAVADDFAQQVRTRLDALTRSGSLIVLDEGDKATSRPRLWGAA